MGRYAESLVKSIISRLWTADWTSKQFDTQESPYHNCWTCLIFLEHRSRISSLASYCVSLILDSRAACRCLFVFSIVFVPCFTHTHTHTHTHTPLWISFYYTLFFASRSSCYVAHILNLRLLLLCPLIDLYRHLTEHQTPNINTTHNGSTDAS